MKLQIKKGTTSKSVTVFIQDSSSSTGAGLTGLVYNSAGLTAYYYREGAGTGATAITLATMTLGTWATGGFVVVDGTNTPGFYELGIPDAALASGADSVSIMLKGATNMAPLTLEIQLTDVDLHDSVRGGMTALPNAAADAAGGLPISDAGGLDLDTLLGYLTASVATASALATAQADLDTITGADGVTLATSQGSITFGAITVSVTGATNNITLAGSGTGDGLVFTRSGSGGLFGTNWAAALESESNDALVAFFTSSAQLVTDIVTNAVIAELTTQGDTNEAAIAALNNLSAAQVNAEVVDALATDTYAEPGQGAPAATTSLAAKINYLYKAWRNKTEQTATTLSVYDDAGTTVDQKSTVSDDGTTATKGEIVSGP